MNFLEVILDNRTGEVNVTQEASEEKRGVAEGIGSEASAGSQVAAADAFDYLIVVFATAGVAINMSSLVILMRKRSCSMFHKLLKVCRRRNFAAACRNTCFFLRKKKKTPIMCG